MPAVNPGKNLACKILRLGWVAIATPSLPTQYEPPEGSYITGKAVSCYIRKSVIFSNDTPAFSIL
jgi:hypothetical protein